MNLKSKGTSPQLIVTLVAAVALNSAALWWHRRQLLTNGDSSKDKEDDDEITRLIGNKRASQQRNQYSDISIKHRSQPILKQNLSDDASVTSSTLAPHIVRKTVTDVRVSRPRVKVASMKKKRRSPKRAPRVRDSLLPWNSNNKNNASSNKSKQKSTRSPIRASQRSPVMRDTCHSAVSAPNTSILYDDTFDSPTNSVDGTFTFSSSRKNVAPRVRESLLPWSNKNKQNNTSKLRMSPKLETDGENVDPTPKVSILYDDSLDSPSVESVSSSNLVEESRSRRAAAPRVRDSLLPWKNNEKPSSYSITSSPTAAPSKSLNFQSPGLDASFVSTRSPLMDSTNNRKKSRSRSRRESKEIKEQVWRQSATKLPIGAIKSPTLMKLSLGDTNGVRSLQKVFEC